jgi:hypothetical protein
MSPKTGDSANRKKGQRAGSPPPLSPLLDLLAHWQAANEKVRPSVADVPVVDPATAPAEAIVESIRQRAEVRAQAAIQATPTALLLVGHESLLPPPSRAQKGVIAESARIKYPDGSLGIRVEGRQLSNVEDLLDSAADMLPKMSRYTPDRLLHAAAEVACVFKQAGPRWLAFVLMASTHGTAPPSMLLQQGAATIRPNAVVLGSDYARKEWGDARMREARGDSVGRLFGERVNAPSTGQVRTPPFDPSQPWVARLEALGAVETLSATLLGEITRGQQALDATVSRKEAAGLLGCSERQVDRYRQNGSLQTVRGKRLLLWQVNLLAAQRGLSTSPGRK